MFTKLKQTFIGRPLKSLTEGEGELLGKMQALAMLSSDALSSIAYGPEQVVLVLASLSSSYMVEPSYRPLCPPASS